MLDRHQTMDMSQDNPRKWLLKLRAQHSESINFRKRLMQRRAHVFLSSFDFPLQIYDGQKKPEVLVDGWNVYFFDDLKALVSILQFSIQALTH